MDGITTRIERVTENLRAIQHELNAAAMQMPSDSTEELFSMEALETLKSALDQMRHFLWFYFEVVNQDSNLCEKLRQALRQRTEDTDAAASMDSPAHSVNRAFLRCRLNGKKPN